MTPQLVFVFVCVIGLLVALDVMTRAAYRPTGIPRGRHRAGGFRLPRPVRERTRVEPRESLGGDHPPPHLGSCADAFSHPTVRPRARPGGDSRPPAARPAETTPQGGAR